MTLKSWLAGGVVAGAALMAAPAAVASAHPVSDAGPGPTVQVHGMRAAVGVRLPGTHLPHLAPQMSVTSNNWSGYAAAADSGVHIRFVSANFTIPSLNCANSPLGSSGFAYAGHWAGLDGFNDATVEQTGVDAFCDSSGTPTYYAWYEMYPLAPVAFTGVNPGDAIHVSVFFTGSAYDLALTDLTTGGSIDTTQPCPSGSTCRNKSAEVITEDSGWRCRGRLQPGRLRHGQLHRRQRDQSRRNARHAGRTAEQLDLHRDHHGRQRRHHDGRALRPGRRASIQCGLEQCDLS